MPHLQLGMSEVIQKWCFFLVDSLPRGKKMTFLPDQTPYPSKGVSCDYPLHYPVSPGRASVFHATLGLSQAFVSGPLQKYDPLRNNFTNSGHLKLSTLKKRAMISRYLYPYSLKMSASGQVLTLTFCAWQPTTHTLAARLWNVFRGR